MLNISVQSRRGASVSLTIPEAFTVAELQAALQKIAGAKTISIDGKISFHAETSEEVYAHDRTLKDLARIFH